MVRRVMYLCMVSFLLAACGVRGDLQPPKGVPSTYPQQYPAQQ
jgi:predicted small lipoprotein YifL